MRRRGLKKVEAGGVGKAKAWMVMMKAAVAMAAMARAAAVKAAVVRKAVAMVVAARLETRIQGA